MHEDVALYFLTFSVVEWLPVFVSEEPCLILSDTLVHCHQRMGLRINAYVFMPTHIHLVAFDESHDSSRLKGAITAFRKRTGRVLADYVGRCAPHCFAGVLRDAASRDRVRQFWQPTLHPIALVGEAFWRQKVDYIHDNPRRKGLVLYAEDWRFSSARFYRDGKDPEGDVPVTPVIW